MIRSSKLKLLQLRKLKKSLGFLSQLEGPLLIKGGVRSKITAEELRQKFYQDASKFNWQPPPRAKLAVGFRFFSDERNQAEIYNLVKYYLDLLKGPVFFDDRQVYYLEACICRAGSSKSGSSLFISVKPLIEYNRTLDFYQENEAIIEEEKEFINFYHIISEQYWKIAEVQADILSNCKISKYDRPGLKKYLLPTMMGRFSGIDPLIVDFGGLPEIGKSKEFKQNIVRLISTFRSNIKLFHRIFIPVELEVQITQKALTLSKDLDNIMIDICQEIKRQLLHEGTYVNGYRVYVVDSIQPNIKSGIQLKFLSPGKIMAFNKRVDKTLEILESTWGAGLKV